MPNISPVIVHKPDGYHGWGIEFNKERHFWEEDATAFVNTMYREMLHRDHNFTWFHQCGSNQEKNGRYYGFQFFEVWSESAESVAKQMAKKIAEEIGTVVLEENDVQ